MKDAGNVRSFNSFVSKIKSINGLNKMRICVFVFLFAACVLLWMECFGKKIQVATVVLES